MKEIVEKSLGLPITAKMSLGLDGAQQRAYNGPTYFGKGEDGGNIIFAGICLTTVNLNDGFGTLLYKVPNMASAENERPLLLVNGKEEPDLVQEIIDHFEEEVAAVKESPIIIKYNDQNIEVWLDLSFCQLDGKLTKMLQGRLGSYCLLCSVTRKEAHEVKRIKHGFMMDLSTEKIRETYEALKQLDTDDFGHVYEYIDRAIPYDIRFGITQKPMVKEIQVACHIPPLHCELRGHSWNLDIIIRFVAKKKKWNVRDERANKAYDKVQNSFREDSKEVLGFSILSVHGGDTGPVVKAFFDPATRDKVFDLIPDIEKPQNPNRTQRMEYKESVEEKEHFISVWKKVMQMLWVILRIINSDLMVIVEDFEDYCQELQVLIRTELPWVQFSPTVHAFLAHSPQIIKDNGSRGLMNHSEQGSEATHKLIRYLRERGARKINLKANLQDVYMKLWIITNPAVRCYNRTQKCSFCLMDGHDVRSCPKRESTAAKVKSQDDLIVESLTYKETEE